MSSLDADGKTSTCYRLSLSLLSERCNLQVVNLLSSCQVTTGECCMQVVRLLSESAVCKLQLEDAFCKLSVVTGMLYATGKDVVFRC